MDKLEISVGGEVVFRTGDNKKMPTSREEAIKLAATFREKAIFLDGYAEGVEDKITVSPTLDNIDMSYGTGTTSYGIATSDSALEWVGGLNNMEFKLGDGFSVSKNQSSATLRFITDSNIYLSGDSKNKLLVAAGGCVPFYNSVQTWSQHQYQDGIARVILDLRPPGVYGSDFSPMLLNDGEGNFGSELTIKARPTYEIFSDI
jgi:hypothetical protein